MAENIVYSSSNTTVLVDGVEILSLASGDVFTSERSEDRTTFIKTQNGSITQINIQHEATTATLRVPVGTTGHDYLIDKYNQFKVNYELFDIKVIETINNNVEIKQYETLFTSCSISQLTIPTINTDGETDANIVEITFNGETGGRKRV